MKIRQAKSLRRFLKYLFWQWLPLLDLYLYPYCINFY